MTRHVFIFLATFVVGALLALAARTATHSPQAAAAGPAPAGTAAAPAVPPRPLAETPSSNPKSEISGPTAGAPVNTVCAICGMAVDPKLPTLEYQGKRIGFGCKMCPPKFKADPDKYGPYYLRNEVIKR
jgi:hypothetical protein